jgi:ABC-2 type transport system ATP-binding protein
MQHAERLCDRFLIIAKGKKRFEGAIGEARAAFPPRLVLRTSDTIERLQHAPGVREIKPVGEAAEGGRDYEIILKRGADPQVILKTAFDAGLRLSRFEHVGASLHDIFVALAGEKGAAELEKGDEAEKAA